MTARPLASTTGKPLLGIVLLLLVSGPAAADLDVSSLIATPDTRESARDEQLAHAGDPDAQFRLAARYDSGQGVTQSYAEAFKWYRMAADQDHVQAQVNLGLMYQQGQGVPRDDQAALQWLSRAADAGDATALYSLGLMYYHGNGVPQDFSAAIAWYRRAAAKGEPKAMNNLGIIYGLGEGVPQDDAEAYVWFTLAASRGDKNAAKNRDLTAQELSASKLEAADARVQTLTAEMGL